ncbi:hypothetical protein JB92DRAFT_3129225 [Gautieria morchelliformis]|nr:hypothetical protein JB92DRAFT_3129225 [Gautieria morchelliformis]
MPRQVLGKRPWSSSRLCSLSSSPSRSPTPAYKTRRITHEPPSPDPTPNPKHVKTSLTELDASAHSSSLNSTSGMTTSASATTPRALRASRRVSAQVPHHTPVSRSRGASARPPNDASSSLSDTPILRWEGQVQSSIDTPT